VNYWGDSVTEKILTAVAGKAKGGAIVFGPNLAQFQAPMVAISSAALSSQNVRTVAWDPNHPEQLVGCRYGVIYRREADLRGVPEELRDKPVVAEKKVLGVWTARVVEFDSPIGEGALRGLIRRPFGQQQPGLPPPRRPLRSD
jgi:hypothetical protein